MGVKREKREEGALPLSFSTTFHPLLSSHFSFFFFSRNAQGTKEQVSQSAAAATSGVHTRPRVYTLSGSFSAHSKQAVQLPVADWADWCYFRHARHACHPSGRLVGFVTAQKRFYRHRCRAGPGRPKRLRHVLAQTPRENEQTQVVTCFFSLSLSFLFFSFVSMAGGTLPLVSFSFSFGTFYHL